MSFDQQTGLLYATGTILPTPKLQGHAVYVRGTSYSASGPTSPLIGAQTGARALSNVGGQPATLVRAQANLSLETYRHDVTPSHQQKTPAGAHITLGRALRQKGYFQEALKEYEKAIEGGEANAEVLQAMLELYLLQPFLGNGE